MGEQASGGAPPQAEDARASVYVLLRADPSCYGADYIVGVFSSLAAAQAASGEQDGWGHSVDRDAESWSSGWHGIEHFPVMGSES